MGILRRFKLAPMTSTPPPKPDTEDAAPAVPDTPARQLAALSDTRLAYDALPPSYDPQASTLDIYHCFRLILGRNPSPPEWPGHAARAGQPLSEVVQSFVGSLEFARRGLGTTAPANVEVGQVNGAIIHASPQDQAVGAHVLSGTYEAHVARLFHEHVKPGMTVLDVGANIGYFAILAASLVGASGRVYAVEPNPHNARLLESSRQANGFSHLTVHQLAAGREPGLLVLNTAYSNGTTATPSRELAALMASQTVPCIDLDTLLAATPRLDLVKIDVEGAELNALTGARALLERFRPVILSEFSPPMLEGISQGSGEDYLRYLVDLGYVISVIGHGRDTPEACGQDVARVLAAFESSGVDHIDILAAPA